MYVFFKVSIHVQQTTQLKHYAAYSTEEGRQQTNDKTEEGCENKRQKDAKMNWNSWHGSPGTRSWKSYQTSGNKHLFKYINIYNRIYQRYTGPKKEREQGETWIKHGCGKFKKRNTGTEDYWSRRELSRMQKKRSGMQKERTKAEMQKMRNAEMIYERREWMKKNMQSTDIKEKDSLHTAESIKISWKLWKIKINSNSSSTIFYIFILLRIKTFISTNNQAETAFYAKEEGLRKVKEEQSK